MTKSSGGGYRSPVACCTSKCAVSRQAAKTERRSRRLQKKVRALEDRLEILDATLAKIHGFQPSDEEE